MFNQAKTWSTRPSVLSGITQDYRAYCFDEAVASWGNVVTNELEKIEGKTDKEVNRKRHARLMKLMDAPDSQRFAPLRGKSRSKK